MAPTLYILHGSPPVRAVLITAKVLGISLNLHEVDYTAGELYSAGYLKLNPQHTVPTLKDDGKIVWDSHAINAYLVGKYAKDDSLYPTDLHKRALVDQKLHFDTGVAFALLRSILIQIFKKGLKIIPPEKYEEIEEVYAFVEKFLEGREWIAGDNLTIADFSCVATITSLNAIMKIESKLYPKIINWIKSAQELPCFTADKEELEKFTQFIRNSFS